jgi:hypothetical protein
MGYDATDHKSVSGISRAQNPAVEYDRQQERPQTKEKPRQQSSIIIIGERFQKYK